MEEKYKKYKNQTIQLSKINAEKVKEINNLKTATKYLINTNKNLEEKNNELIREKNVLISEKNDIISKKNDVINNLINEKNDIISEKNELINRNKSLEIKITDAISAKEEAEKKAKQFEEELKKLKVLLNEKKEIYRDDVDDIKVQEQQHEKTEVKKRIEKQNYKKNEREKEEDMKETSDKEEDKDHINQDHERDKK